MRVRMKLDDDGMLAIEDRSGAQKRTVRSPVAETLMALFGALEAELAMSRDGAVSLQFDAAPNSVIAELIERNALQIKTIDGLVAEVMADIEAEPDAGDVADLLTLRDRLGAALIGVEAALAVRRGTS